MIMVEAKKNIPKLPDFVKRECLVCGERRDWLKITLIKGVGMQGMSFALCSKCAMDLIDKICQAVQDA